MLFRSRRAEALQFKFNEDRELSGSEDWELWLRLSANFGLRRGKKNMCMSYIT